VRHSLFLNTVFPLTDGTGEAALDMFRAEETEDTLTGVLEQESESKAHSDTDSPPPDTDPPPEVLSNL